MTECEAAAEVNFPGVQALFDNIPQKILCPDP